MARILIYGSSTAYGLYGGPKGGWAERLKTTFTQRDITPRDTVPRGRVFNLAISALTLPQIVTYLPLDIPRYSGKGRTLGIFMVGGIESTIVGEGATDPKVPVKQFQRSLAESTTVCREHNVRQIFVGLPYSDDTRSAHPSVRTEHELRRTYDNAVRVHAEYHGLPFVNVYDHLESEGYKPDQVLAYDGDHPNALGHAIIHKLVLAQVDTILQNTRHFKST